MSAFRSIESIVGHRLSSVEFARSYLKMNFDGPSVTLFTWPVLATGEFSLEFQDVWYRNELCKRICCKVLHVVTTNPDFILIAFDDASSLYWSLERGTGRDPGYFKPGV
jgi:hypothetical protein